MNRRPIIIIVTVVVAAHALLLVFWWSGNDETNDEAGLTTTNVIDGDDLPQREEVALDKPEESSPYDLLSGQAPRVEASNTLPSPDLTAKPVKATETGIQKVAVDPQAMAKGEIPAGAINVGIHTGTTKLSPEFAEVATRGAVAASEQRWEDARSAYLELINATPDNALAYANLGVAEFQLGNLVAASGNLKRSLELNPSIGNNWQTLGLIQYEQKNLNLAISSLTRAIHEAPRDAQARVYLAAVIRDYGWTEAALTELKRAIDIDPNLPDAHYNLAVTYLEIRSPRIELARRHYYKAIDLGAAPAPELEKALDSAE